MAILDLDTQTTPERPESNAVKLFFDSNNSNHLTQIDSNGTIIDLTKTALTIRFPMINNTGFLIEKGSAVKFDGYDDNKNIDEMVPADADDESSMPAIGILETDVEGGGTGFITFQGNVTGLNTGSFEEGDQLYVGKTPGALTNERPTGGDTLIQSIGSAGKINDNTGTIVVHGALRANDLPNINFTKIWQGDIDGIPREISGIPLSQRVINSLADLPPVVAGQIIGEDNVFYVLGADITTPDEFLLGANSAFRANNIFAPVWTYTGTGSAFRGVDVNFTIAQMSIIASNGEVFNMSSPTTDGGNFFVMQSVFVFDCDKYATYDNMRVVDITDAGAISVNDGTTVLGTTNWQIFSMTKSNVNVNVSGGIALDLGTSLHNTLELTDLIYSGPSGSIGISGETDSDNVRVGQLATIKDSEFSGDMIPFVGVNKSDIRIEMQDNNTPNSEKIAETFLTASQTVINTGQGDFNPIGGVLWDSDVAERFTTNTTGQLVYISEIDGDFKLTGTATVSKTGGGSNQLAVRIALNDTPAAKTEAVTQNATPTSVNSQGLFMLTKDDVLDLQVANLDAGVGTDTIVSRANLIVSQA